jgi:hypothetical protein
MFKGILIHLRPVTLLIVVLAIALDSAPAALAEQPKQEAAPSDLPTPTTAIPTAAAAGGTSGPYYSIETITLIDGTQLDQVTINGPAKPPPGYELERAPVAPSALNQPGVAASLSVPAFSWVFGCSSVSASMIGAYFDRNGLPNIYTGPTNGGVMPMDNSVWPTWTDSAGVSYPGNPLAASRSGSDGRTTRGSIDDYWVAYNSAAQDPFITGGWTQHAWGDAFGDYMKTSQSGYSNPDGSTYFSWYTNGTPLTCAGMESLGLAGRDGSYGRKLFYEARGISVTECYNQRTDNAIAGGFSFANYKAQIDAGYPVILNLAGHTIVGVGYLAPSTVYIHDTWDYLTHEMIWGGSYSGMALQSVSVVNPVISTPAPTVTGLNPSSATAGGPAFTLTVSGTSFVGSSVVRWNGSNRTTTYVSGTQLTAAITAADIVAATTASVTVFNPAPGGGTSNALSFSVTGQNPVPSITGLNPSSATPGGPAFTLTVNGTNFVGSSVVRWNGANRTTTYVNGTQLTAAITAADIVALTTASVTVFNPVPGGGTSNAVSFSVTAQNPVPTITGLNPSSATPGGPACTLTVNGTNFLSSSVVRWNGANRTTTYVNSTQLTAAIAAADIAAAGTASVTVFNPAPGGGPSNALSFLVATPTKVYLPFVLKDYPPIPVVPVLDAIANADGDGNYTVSWNASARAASYLLQEDDNAAFSSPDTRYSGAGTSWNAAGKAVGTYYYRVQASNTWGPSGWSNTRSVVVQPPSSGPTPGFWQQSGGAMEFYVTSDRAFVYNFAVNITVSGCGTYKITHLTQEPISGNHFSFTGPFYASGTFSSQTAASGTTGLSSFPISGCGNVSGGPWAWTANWMHSAQLMQVEATEANQVDAADPGNAYEVTRIP